MHHENFWVVVGAAAPVIALANLVALGDVWISTDPRDNHLRIPIALISMLNLLVQGFILIASLQSYLINGDSVSANAVSFIEGCGVFACGIVAYLSGMLRNAVRGRAGTTAKE